VSTVNPIENPFQVVETGSVSNGQSNRNPIPSGRNRIRVKRSIEL
jgi:hypothetical protein